MFPSFDTVEARARVPSASATTHTSASARATRVDASRRRRGAVRRRAGAPEDDAIGARATAGSTPDRGADRASVRHDARDFDERSRRASSDDDVRVVDVGRVGRVGRAQGDDDDATTKHHYSVGVSRRDGAGAERERGLERGGDATKYRVGR